MLSLSYENRFITFFRRISKSARLLLTALTLTVSFFLIHCFVYLPVSLEIENKASLLNNMFKAGELLRLKLSEYDSIKKDNQVLEDKFQKELCDSGTLQDNMDFVLNSLHSNGMFSLKFEPVGFKQKDFYRKEYYSLQAKSSFQDILNFLNNLEVKNKFLKFKSVEFITKKSGLILVLSKLRFIDFLNKKDD